MADYVFHVLHNARPEYEMDILMILRNGSESTHEEVFSDGESLGLLIGTRVNTERMLKDILQSLRDLDLMERRKIKLTESGQTLAQIAYSNPGLFPEIFHYLCYSAWNAERETQKCFSWSYRILCKYLWGQSNAILSNDSLASFISAEASQRFQIKSVSFSSNSVNGIIIWLEALTPPVIHCRNGQSNNKTFSRRTFCPPELFVLGVDFFYQSRDIDYGVNLHSHVDHKAIWEYDSRLNAPDGVPNAYHKHDCLAVLVYGGNYDVALEELNKWIMHLEFQGKIYVEEYPTGATGLQIVFSGLTGYAVRIR
jgi:hypothetical protein